MALFLISQFQIRAMKKIFLYFFTLQIIIMTMTILQSCTKDQVPSDEVLISITNECRCKIKVYDMNQRNVLQDIFDCSYKSILPLKLKPGKWKIVAETYQSKTITKLFTKGLYAQEIDIEF